MSLFIEAPRRWGLPALVSVCEVEIAPAGGLIAGRQPWQKKVNNFESRLLGLQSRPGPKLVRFEGGGEDVLFAKPRVQWKLPTHSHKNDRSVLALCRALILQNFEKSTIFRACFYDSCVMRR